MIELVSIGKISNTHNKFYIVDTETELGQCESDFGNEAYCIANRKKYICNGSGTYVEKASGSGSLPEVTSADNGKVAGVVNGQWNKIDIGPGISYQVVNELPQTGEVGVIYLVPIEGSTNDVYDEYLWVNNAFEKIGTTEVALEVVHYAYDAPTETWSCDHTGAEIFSLMGNLPVIAIWADMDFAYQGILQFDINNGLLYSMDLVARCNLGFYEGTNRISELRHSVGGNNITVINKFEPISTIVTITDDGSDTIVDKSVREIYDLLVAGSEVRVSYYNIAVTGVWRPNTTGGAVSVDFTAVVLDPSSLTTGTFILRGNNSGQEGADDSWTLNVVDISDSFVPAGGNEGQVLAKTADLDYATGWVDPTPSIPAGGDEGYVLAKSSSTNYDTHWIGSVVTGVGQVDNQVTFAYSNGGAYTIDIRAAVFVNPSVPIIEFLPLFTNLYQMADLSPDDWVGLSGVSTDAAYLCFMSFNKILNDAKIPMLQAVTNTDGSSYTVASFSCSKGTIETDGQSPKHFGPYFIGTITYESITGDYCLKLDINYNGEYTCYCCKMPTATPLPNQIDPLDQVVSAIISDIENNISYADMQNYSINQTSFTIPNTSYEVYWTGNYAFYYNDANWGSPAFGITFDDANQTYTIEFNGFE